LVLTSRFEEALVYAAQIHTSQVRKGSRVPYISHLLAVASLVIENGGSEDESIAALLHDAIEDQGGPAAREQIVARFGENVARIVSGVSDADSSPKPPWRERKEAYLVHLRRASASERLVSAADKLHNARSIVQDYRQHGEVVWERFRGGKEGSLWYYRSLVAAFESFGPHPLTVELRQVVDEMVRLSGEC
jgi:(p)ppGpp synthase/HD superfamily hydrolase